MLVFDWPLGSSVSTQNKDELYWIIIILFNFMLHRHLMSKSTREFKDLAAAVCYLALLCLKKTILVKFHEI
jgi:hypothetical protein